MPKSAKQRFLDTFAREHERTMRVLRAYPDDQSDFRPHPRSRTAREVARPLVLAGTPGLVWPRAPEHLTTGG